MRLIPEIHLDNWDISDDIQSGSSTYEHGRIKIIEDKERVSNLYIKSSDGQFHHIKEVDNYWELMSYNTFLNSDVNCDSVDMEFQLQLLSNIRDNFSSFETIIINKKTGYVFGVNNLIDSGGWNDETLYTMWENDEIIVIDLLDDVDPVILTKTGWHTIDVNYIGVDIDLSRTESIKDIL